MKVSFEYAKALYYLSPNLSERKEINKYLSELVFDSDVLKFFKNPMISSLDKKKIIDEFIKNKLLVNFFYCLIDSDRFDLYNDIKSDYNELLLNEINESKVKVYSKVKLDKSYLNKLEISLKDKIDGDIELENIIDNKIIGGIRIVYKSKELDYTINSKFESLKNFLKE